MLLSCGDALIDFIPQKTQDNDDAFRPLIGGSCLNVAVTMARLGAPAGFLGALSDDFLGDMIADHASASGVSLDRTSRLPLPATTAFVKLATGEPQYVFYDSGTAARNWQYVSGAIIFSEVEAIHFGSTTLVHDDLAARTFSVLQEAKGLSTISFDPNCRPGLVQDRKRYLITIENFARSSDIVKMSGTDFEFLYGHRDYEQKASQLFSSGVTIFFVTRGGKSTIAYHRSGAFAEVKVRKIQERDTIGAGDTFQGALLVALNENGRLGPAGSLDLSEWDLEKLTRFASDCAGLTCERVGADPPRKHELPQSWWSAVNLSAGAL